MLEFLGPGEASDPETDAGDVGAVDVIGLGDLAEVTDDEVDGIGPAPTRRYKLWEIPPSFHCSIIGTCLPHADLVPALRRIGLKPEAGAEDYEVHAYLVGKAAADNPVARLLQKLLEKRAGGELRRFGRAANVTDLAELWRQAVAIGRVGPAYWALHSHPATTNALRCRAFGQIHMLSHFMAGANQDHINHRSAAERRCQELQEAYERLQRSSQDQMTALRQALDQAQRNRSSPSPPAASSAAVAVDSRLATLARAERQLRHQLDRASRRLAVERARARAAEAEATRLKALIGAPGLLAGRAPLPPAGGGAADEAGWNCLRQRSILYIGGRHRVVQHLRAVVDRYQARLLHHDGGMEENIRTLDGLVEKCDVVCCPIDCISHDACSRAKQLCKRHRKPFVPLRSSGTASFLTALRGVTGAAAEPESGD